MKIFVQWCLRTPRDYQLRDSAEWATLPTKPSQDLAAPADTMGLDNTPGWVNVVGIQGVSFQGYDHYAVEDINDGLGGIRCTVWSDSTTWNPLGKREAQTWTILPLAPDAKFGGALNTRQSRVIYAEKPDAWLKWSGVMPAENTVLLEWPAFETDVLPRVGPLARHGIWMTDALYASHLAALTEHGWREWAT